MLENIIAIVLAGGVGGRLKPLTNVRSKPSVPYGGVYRLFDLAGSNCVNSGIRNIKVLAQYRSRSLNEHMKRAWNFLSYRVGEEIELVHSSKTDSDDWESLGTADAIRKNMYITRESHKDEVLILAGDHIYKMDYGLMNQFHDEKKSPLTIATIKVPVERARGDLGVLEVDKKGRIVGFEEKPINPKTIPGEEGTCVASMGIYLFDMDMLERSLNNDLIDFGKHVIPMLIKEGAQIFSYDFSTLNKIKEYEYVMKGNKRVKVLSDCAHDSGTWYDVGKLTDFYAANMDLVSTNPTFNLYGEKWPLYCAPVYLPPGKTVHDADGRRGAAYNSLISNGAIISGATVRRSILGPLTYVHSYALVEDSYLMGGEINGEHRDTSIGRGCKIRNAIIDKNVVIPEGMTIGYDRNTDENINKFTVVDLKEPTQSGGTYIVCVPKGWPNPEHEQMK